MEQLIKLLKSQNVDYRLVTHEPVMTMEDVKRILKVDLSITAKTLVVKAKNELILVAIPGNCRLDKKKLSRLLGIGRNDIDMLQREEVEEKLGVILGAIPPFGLGLPVVLDQQLMTLENVYCGFGLPTQSLIISPKDLQVISSATLGDVSV